jgi:PKD repeat protein
MFTEGQKLWMEAALNISWTGRQNLWSATNLINTGVNGPSPLCAPKADFFSNTNIVCVGSGVTFRDASWNGNPTSWNWSFPGANISSSTSSSETISYPSPGIYTVSLSVSNSAGTDMASKTGYIQVVPSLATHTLSSYTESFESAGIPNAHWSIFDENGFNSWTSTTAAAYSGNASILLNNYTPGSYDELYSAGIDVSAVQNPLLSFMLAYTQKSNEDDKLEIFASANCGQTWNQRYQKTGSLLATAPATFNYFIPTSSQWRKEYINLSPFINSDNVRIKFKFTSAGGNNIYIDDINLSSYFVGIDEKENSGNSIHVYPNPLENTSVITMKLSERSSIELTLFNIMGQKVNSFVSGEKLPGEYTFPLNNNLSKGVYLLILNDGKQQINKKIVVN